MRTKNVDFCFKRKEVFVDSFGEIATLTRDHVVDYLRKQSISAKRWFWITFGNFVVLEHQMS